MELLEMAAVATKDVWGLRVDSPVPLMTVAEHDALASFLVSVEPLDLQQDAGDDKENKRPSKRKRRETPIKCRAAASGQDARARKKKISTHQRRKNEMDRLNQTLVDLRKCYEQVQSERRLRLRKARGAYRVLIETLERKTLQATAANMHLRRSVHRAQAKANTLCRLMAQLAKPSPIIRRPVQPLIADCRADTDIFQMLELRLGSKALGIHQRLLEGEFQLPKAMCESNDASVNPDGNMVDFSTVRIVPFGVSMINDITWRCYDEMNYAPGMVQLSTEKCGDIMTVKQVVVLQRTFEPDISLVLHAVFQRFKRGDHYIVTWEGVISGSQQADGRIEQAFSAQTRESGWGIARPVEPGDDSTTVLQTFVQVAPCPQTLPSSDLLVNQTLPTYSWVLDKRYQELENRLFDAAV